MFSPQVKRIYLLVIGACECLFFGGWIFGWASLVFVFKREGYFADRCFDRNSTVPVGLLDRAGAPTESPATTTQPPLGGECDEQDRLLQLVFTVANFCVAGAAFPLGLLFDRFGTLFMRILISILMLAGSLMFAFSSSTSAFLVFPAAVCVSMGGVQLLVVNLQISNLFGRHKWVVMTILCGCFDSSAVVFLIVKVLYEHLNVQLQSTFYVLTGTTFLFSFNTFFLLPKRAHIPWPLPGEYYDQRHDTGATRELDDVKPKHVYMKDVADDEERYYHKTTEAGNDVISNLDTKIDDKGSSKKDQECNDRTTEGDSTISLDTARLTEAETNPIAKDFPSLRSCILSPSFFFFYLWFSILQLDVLFFFSTLNAVLTRLADQDDTIVSKYTNAIAFIQLGGIACAPISGLLLSRNKANNRCRNKEKEAERLKQRGPYSDLKDAALVYAVCTSIAILFCICGIIPILDVQYATFVLSVVSRSFLYSLTASGTNLLFPGEYFGALYGLMIGLSAVFSLLQYPLFIVTQDVFDGDDFWVKTSLLGASVLTYSLPIFIFFHSRRKEKSFINQQNNHGKESDNINEQEYQSVYL